MEYHSQPESSSSAELPLASKTAVKGKKSLFDLTGTERNGNCKNSIRNEFITGYQLPVTVTRSTVFEFVEFPSFVPMGVTKQLKTDVDVCRAGTTRRTQATLV